MDDAAARARRLSLVALAAIVLAGLILRAVPLVGHAWPVGDGGLFWTMVGELRAGGLVLPATTAYNGAGIPFAYPPLALGLAALLEALTPLTRADLFRLLPLAASTACIPAFYLLAGELLPTRTRALFATLVYATLPYGYAWFILGSGLPRSIGFLLALLATWQGLRLLREGRRRQVALTGVLAGLAALSHPEAAAFVALGLAVGFLFARSRRNLGKLILAAMIAGLVTAPWLTAVVARHGLAPFAAAAGVARDPTSSAVGYLFGFLLASPLPAAALLDLLGQARELVARRPYLVAWRLAIFFLDLRFALVAAVVPLSLLASEGLFDVVVPALKALARPRARPVRTPAGPAVGAAGEDAGAPGARLTAPGAVLAVGLLLASSLLAPSVFLAPHTALAAADLAALGWVREHQPPGRRFLVLAGAEWGSDDLSEWFPALAERTSVATSQGLEWVDPSIRATEAAGERALRACQPSDLACLRAWLAAYAPGDTAVYVPANGSAVAAPPAAGPSLVAQLRAAAGPGVAYDGPGALIVVGLP